MNKPPSAAKDRKSGQAIIFLVMVLVIGTLALLWNFDLHNIVSTKIRVDNAGDAAALSAARWQAITLNMIGELNLSQAAFVCEQLASADPTIQEERDIIKDDAENIALLRQRLALIGPLMGLVAAQSAALKNVTDKDVQRIEEANSRFMAKRGEDFENSGGFYMDVVAEPYPDAWAEYGGLVSTIANNTMIVECANAQYFMYYTGNHTLLDPHFYRAVAGQYWCYFKSGDRREYIDTYESFESWKPLPPLQDRHTMNSEYFSTDVYEYEASVNTYYYPSSNWPGYASILTNYYTELEVDSDQLREDFLAYFEQTSPTDSADYDMMDLWGMSIPFFWHYFERWSWLHKSGYDSGMYFPDSDDFPFDEGWGFKDEYNYGGGDASVDVRIDSVINTPGMQLAVGDIYWQASAKVFGYLERGSAEERVSPVYYGLVLPAFHDVRLIHNDLSSRKSGVDHPGYDEHVYEHLPEYLEEGIPGIEENDCWYCKQLKKWEDPGLREAGSSWLEENQDRIDAGLECRPYQGNPNMGRG